MALKLRYHEDALADLEVLFDWSLYVYYRVDEARGAVEILHFWHTARQPPNL